MKQLMKKGLSLLLVLMLIISLLPGISLTADASAVTYRYSSEGYIYNWGSREEIATFLSPNAEAFYEGNGVTYTELAALSGASSTSSVASSALYQELYELMSGAQTHTTSYDETKNLFQYTDCENNGSPSTISSFYSGIAIGPSWDGTWNREHTWPNSKGLGGSDEDDIMMLRPTSQTENSSRGNKGYGESSGYYHPNSESNGEHDLRGDVARIFLYVYVRWGNVNGNGEYDTWGSEGVFESKELLLAWMEEDPVDTWELGRNDSVESITGTRNLFVDYPELAFELFEAEVPAMQTPSGIANSSYTVSAVSSNTAHGTVSVSGTNITATPAEGYAVSGYELLSGSATVTQNGNVFLVSPASDCQIRINFVLKTPVSLTFVESSGAAVNQTAYMGEAMTMPEHTGTVPDGYTFRGWVTEQVQDSTSKPAAVYAAGDSYTPSAAQTFYALYSWVEGEGTGEPVATLVTSGDSLSAGMTVIIASANYDVAMSTTQNGNNRGQASITKNSDNTIDYGDDVQIFTLETGTVSGSYAFNTGDGYLYAASSSSNWLRTKSDLDDNGSFVITVSSDGSCDVVAKGTYTRNNMEYNKSSALFSCYPTSNQQTPVAIYAITQSGTLHYTTAQDATFQIVTQPADVTIEAGPNAYFTVEAIGDGLTYQWQYRTSASGTWAASPATGNQTATLTVPGTTWRSGYQYRCVITNESGAVLYSDVATLTVTEVFAITAQPVSSEVTEGTASNFTVTVTGSSLTYQWQYREGESYSWKSSPATGNKTAALTIPGTVGRNGYQYRCVITNGSGDQLISDVATLTVHTNLQTAVKEWSLILGDDIGANFALKLMAHEAAEATVTMTVSGETTTVSLADVTADANGYYVVEVNVAAAQMNDAIVIAINDTQLTEQYSVREYADYILDEANGYDDITKALVTQMLQYGSAAQTLFAYNAENPANAGYEDTAENSVPAAGQEALVSGEAEGISFYAASMVCRSKIAVRYYFSTTGDIRTYRFQVGETVCTPEEKGGLYYVEIAGIGPAELDEVITLTVTDAQNNSLNVTYGPMNYIVRQYHKTENASLKALLQQLYDYYLAAESYAAV